MVCSDEFRRLTKYVGNTGVESKEPLVTPNEDKASPSSGDLLDNKSLGRPVPSPPSYPSCIGTTVVDGDFCRNECPEVWRTECAKRLSEKPEPRTSEEIQVDLILKAFFDVQKALDEAYGLGSEE